MQASEISEVNYPELLTQLNELIEPATRGDPENPLRWSSKSTIKLTQELNNLGYKIDQKTVYNLLNQQDYSMKSNRKSLEGKADHPDRDAQFDFINKQASTNVYLYNKALNLIRDRLKGCGKWETAKNRL